jgi:hypothetical protein
VPCDVYRRRPTRSSPARSTPSTVPLDGAETDALGDVAGRPARHLVAREMPVALAARRSAGTRRTSASIRVQPSASPIAVSRGACARSGRSRSRPTRRRAAPARLDQDTRELAPADVQIVRPLHADRLRRQSSSASAANSRSEARARRARSHRAGARRARATPAPAGDVQRRPASPAPPSARRQMTRSGGADGATSFATSSVEVTDACRSTRGTPSSASSSLGGMTVVADRRRRQRRKTT